MTNEDAIRELRRLRYGRRSLSAIAKAAGLNRITLYRAINSGTVTEATGQALVRALKQTATMQHVPQTPLSDVPKAIAGHSMRPHRFEAGRFVPDDD